MSIERIKEEAAKADQRIAELAAQASGSADETPAVEAEAEQPEVVQQTDQGVVDAATDDHQQAPAAPGDDAQKWEARYRSLDGMIQSRDRQIEQLHQLIAGMQQAQKTGESAPEPKGPKGNLITPDDEDSFGADMVDMVRRACQDEFARLSRPLADAIEQLKQSVQGVSNVTAMTVQERFEDQLTRAVPNWRQIDADPKFIAWLQASPTRDRMFKEAAAHRVVEDIAYMFDEYANKHAPAPAAARTDDRLSKMVAPGKAKSGPTPAQTQETKKQWTRSEIAAVYASKHTYKAEEFNRIEREIALAQREGRVDFDR